MSYKAKGANKPTGVDDMVLLAKIENESIVENLEKRLKNDIIYTFIGPVLIAVNPFKYLPYFTDKDIEKYQESASYENPPHIFALCSEMYRNMVSDLDSQCVIISGESGAGKTVSAKYVMNYISKVSGGGNDVQNVKDVILQSNPLLEAFGNAKTIRNDNSSRFGKYVEILFSRGGIPNGGKISNFLLEKSRVVTQNKGERSFHIFYQVICGLDSRTKSEYELDSIEKFYYLSQSKCTTVDGIDDVKEFKDVESAMNTIGLRKETQDEIFKLIAAILHIGNISLVEDGNKSKASSDKLFDMPAKLLGVSAQQLKEKVITREMESKWGKTSEIIYIEHTVEQATFTRDALCKGIYSRIFSYLVEEVNKAIKVPESASSIGILDIYGFEIFQKNGFEQYCINYVNEKLQQIFIELTLKKEQEEYVEENIKWTPIKYFNNKVVCDLIESKKNPLGIFSILDDVCATMHAKSEGADNKLIEDLSRNVNNPSHFNISGMGFIITHYAGKVTYDADGFCERNRDVFFVGLLELVKSSSNKLLASLFPEDIESAKKGRPTTLGTKIRTQANELVDKLMKCTPHYIRCIKPNETKKPYDFDMQRVKHQVEYLGLKENIRIKRAGFAFRIEFNRFMRKYALLTPETYPKWSGSVNDGIKHIMDHCQVESDEWQLGKTKVFIKKPESLFLLEEILERKYDNFATRIQKCWRGYFSTVKVDKNIENASKLVLNKKQRFHGSISRKFYGDYIGTQEKTNYQQFMGRKEKVLFSDYVYYYDKKFKSAKLDLLTTKKALYLIGREKVKKGPQKGQIIQVVSRKIPMPDISSISLSNLQDDLVCINVTDDFSTLIQTVFKTEFIYVLSDAFKTASGGKTLPISFDSKMLYMAKKSTKGGSTKCTVEFKEEIGFTNDVPKTKSSGAKLTVQVKTGKPASSVPEAKGASKSNRGGRTNAPTQSSNAAPTRAAPQQVKIPEKKAPKPPPPKAQDIGLVLWDYEAGDDDEINLKEGDEVEIVKKDDSGWWIGICKGKRGLFPANYVEVQ